MDLSAVDNIEGPNLMLRLIQPEDTAYVYGLRTNPLYNRHLSKVTGNFDDQLQWIKSYKSREAEFKELYYVIERKNGTRCGLVRLYDIEAECFTWGSWILDDNKPSKAALESALLSFGVGFDAMERPAAKVDVRLENTHATAFYRRLRMTETHRTEQDIYFIYPRDQFRTDRSLYLKLLKGE